MLSFFAFSVTRVKANKVASLKAVVERSEKVNPDGVTETCSWIPFYYKLRLVSAQSRSPLQSESLNAFEPRPTSKTHLDHAG